MFPIDSGFSELCNRLCLTLAHSLWQVALVAAIAWMVSRTLAHRRTNAQYAIHLAALLLGLAAAPFTFLVLGDSPARPAAAPLEQRTPVVAVPATPMARLEAPPVAWAARPPVGATTGWPAPPVAPRATDEAPVRVYWSALSPWVVGAYALGVSLMLLRLLVSAVRAERLGASARSIDEGPLFDTLKDLCHRMSLRVRPRLAAVDRIVTPKVVGLLRPAILVPPSALAGLSPAELEMVLAHELAHLRRHDLWVNLVQRLCEAVLFYHPAAWWLSRRVSRLREYGCDEAACAAVGGSTDDSRVRYASALLRTVELERGEATSAELAALAATGRSPSELRLRVARLFGEPLREPLGLSRSLLLAVTVAAGALCLTALADSQPGGRGRSEAKPPAEPTRDENLAVAAARMRTFGLQDAEKVLFKQVYRQAPAMQSHPDDSLDSLWLARSSEIAESEFDRNRHETLLGWDDGRLLIEAFHPFRADESSLQTRYWNGQEGWLGETAHTKEGEIRNVYRYADIGRLNDRIPPYYFPHWAAAGDRLPWPGPAVLLAENNGAPARANYFLAGEESVDGALCDVYDSPKRQEKLWVDREQGLVKAVARYYVFNVSDEQNWEALREAAGRDFSDRDAYQDWYDEQSPEKQAALAAKWRTLTWEHATPGNLTVFSDYREVAPGVVWPHHADRIVVHSNHRDDGTYRYVVAKIAVEQVAEFDLEKVADNALPKTGDKVTDRTAGTGEFQYEWSPDLDNEFVVRLRREAVAEAEAEEEAERLINEAPIESVADAIRVLIEGPDVDPNEIWARAIKFLADHPDEALPALIAALDGEEQDHPISKLAFALRAIGDARAVPALIRALPRTLQPSRSDFGLNLDDRELCRFMQRHDNRGKVRPGSNSFTYGRALREVAPALQRLTGQEFGETQLNWIHLEGSEHQRRIAQAQFDRVAQQWADWWEANWQDHVDDPAFAVVNLPSAQVAEPQTLVARIPPSGRGVELSGDRGDTLQSVHNGDRECFVDLDTGRFSGWPDELPALGRTRLDSPELLGWARREGFDIVGVTHTPAGESAPLYCVKPLDLRAWKITEREHRDLDDFLSGEKPYPLDRPVDLLVPRRTIPKPWDPKHSGDSFLFVTREGTAGVMRLTAQVTRSTDIRGRMLNSNDQFEDLGFFRGVKYEVQTMSVEATTEPGGRGRSEAKPPAERDGGVDSNAPGAAADAADPGHPVLGVSVLDPAGAPVGDVRARVSKSWGFEASWVRVGEVVEDGRHSVNVRADAAGRLEFDLGETPPRHFRLFVEEPGYGPYLARWNSTDHPDPIPAEHTAQLERGWSVGGVVVDRSGRPVAGAKIHPSIEFKKRPGDASQLAVGASVTTDSAGVWRYDSVPESYDTVTVTISHPDYAHEIVSLARGVYEVAAAMTPTAPIEIGEGLSVAGRVTDTAGRPIPGATLRTQFVNDTRTATTDADGRYRLTGCEQKMARIVISAPGKAMDMQTTRVEPGMAPVDFVLQEGGHVRVRVVDENGEGIPKARIFFQRWRGQIDYFEFDHVDQYTNDQGVWEWNEAPLDEFKADVCRPNGMQLLEETLVARDEEYVFSPPRKLEISGKIVDAKTGEPIKNARVTPGVDLSHRGTPQWNNAEAYKATNGEYRIAFNRLRGAAQVRVEAIGYRAATSRGFLRHEGQVVEDFKLQRAGAIDAIVLTPDGKPATGAKIAVGIVGSQIFLENGDIGDGQTYAQRLSTDEEGRFQLPARDDKFQLWIMHEAGFAHVKSADGPVPDKISLTAWARVEGVFRVGAEPAPGVVLSLYGDAISLHGPDAPKIFTQNEVTTGPGGEYAFERVFPGKGRICRNIVVMVNEGATEVTSSSRVPAEFVAGETTQLDLGGSGRAVVGKLLPPEGQGERALWNFAMVYLEPGSPLPPAPEGPWESWKDTEEGKQWSADYQQWRAAKDAKPYFQASVGRDGRFRIDNAPPGEYVLSVRDLHFEGRLPGNLELTVTVPEGSVEDPPVELGDLRLESPDEP